jgi:hypothetical protein
MAGRVTEEERFGSKMGRIDVPTGDREVMMGRLNIEECVRDVELVIEKAEQLNHAIQDCLAKYRGILDDLVSEITPGDRERLVALDARLVKAMEDLCSAM